jgi:signal peptidase I
MSDPAKFGPMMASAGPGSTYPIRPDNFLMMGDNSPRSSDSRAWGKLDHDWDPERSRWEVPRHLLIGRAFFVYWPHGVPFGPKIPLSPDFRIPFRPYFERMKPIR